MLSNLDRLHLLLCLSKATACNLLHIVGLAVASNMAAFCQVLSRDPLWAGPFVLRTRSMPAALQGMIDLMQGGNPVVQHSQCCR